MNEHDIHEIILRHVCKEIEEIASNIQKNNTMSEQDLKRLDMLYHTKKSMLACWGMEHPEDYFEGSSGMRGRSPSTGRYVSRDHRSYEDGYSQGYAAAMNQNGTGIASGHPVMNPYYPEHPRW